MIVSNTEPNRRGLAGCFAADDRGSVSVLVALYIIAILLVASFLIDLSLLYVEQQRDQVVADAANFAAASTPSAIVGSSASPTAIATAKNIAQINGLGSALTTTSAVSAPSGDGTLALRTTIDKSVDLGLGLLSNTPTSPVSASSWASSSGSAECITSLGGPVNIYGTSVVRGSACAINAKTYLYTCGNADVGVASVRVGYTQSDESPYICATATMVPPKSSFTYGAAITDTIASDGRITAIKSHLQAMASGWSYGTVSPVNPSVAAGGDATYTNATATLPQSTKYGSVTVTSSTLTLPGSGAADPTCALPTTFSGSLVFSGTNTLSFGSGCYVFAGTITVNTGGIVDFTVATGAKVVFVFDGNLVASNSSKISFGDGTYYFNGGSISNNSGSTLKFGNGKFALWGGGLYNVASSSVLSFGTGPFYFYGGTLSNTGSMTFGDGPYYFSGGSLGLNPGSTTVFGVGDVEFYGGTVAAGGASVIFGQGGSTSSGSGTIWVYGGSFSLTSDSLTAIGETFAFLGGSVSFLGIGTINAIAPTSSSPTRGYRDVFLASWDGAFNLYQSSSPADVISGLLYSPLGNVSIYGNQGVSLPANGCFQIMAYIVDIYQSANLATAPCRGFAGSTTSTKVQLLQ